MGVKKSVVATSAVVSFTRYTAASSLVAASTIRFVLPSASGISHRISASTFGASLHPHPPPWAREVSGGSVGISGMAWSLFA